MDNFIDIHIRIVCDRPDVDKSAVFDGVNDAIQRQYSNGGITAFDDEGSIERIVISSGDRIWTIGEDVEQEQTWVLDLAQSELGDQSETVILIPHPEGGYVQLFRSLIRAMSDGEIGHDGKPRIIVQVPYKWAFEQGLTDRD